MQQMRSIGHDPESELAFQRLEKAILEGGGLASRFLQISDPFHDPIEESASALASVKVSVRKVTTDASAVRTEVLMDHPTEAGAVAETQGADRETLAIIQIRPVRRSNS